jgi:1-pyrroline-5-carboxylate dehydrogenase
MTTAALQERGLSLLLHVGKPREDAGRTPYKVKSELGREYDLIIGGEKLRTESKIVSINPVRRLQSAATLDAAVEGIALSAFGFSGQKCSAGSCAIVDARMCDSFLERLIDRVRQIKAGDPSKNFYAGPVINERARRRVLDCIEIGKKEARLVLGGNSIETSEQGYYVAPTIFADVTRTARIAQEEIFGPVLAVIKAHDYDDALNIANDTEYGLTGAVYSLSQEKLDRTREEFHVGNLYFNRKCTGAMDRSASFRRL